MSMPAPTARPLRVLFLNRVHPPDEGATGQLLEQLAGGLAAGGMEVVVLAAGSGDSGEAPGRARVVRARVLAFSRASLPRRALSYLSVYPSLFLRAWRLPRADVVVTLTDPPLLAVLGPLLRWRHGGRLVHWAQDLYPEVAGELGVLRSGGLPARLLRWLSTWALRRHDSVIAVGRCMRQRLEARGLPGESIDVIPNWAVQAAGAPPADAIAAFRAEHGLGGRRVVMYSGNFGLAHPFEPVVEAARILEQRQPRVLFLFVGGGSRLQWLKDRAAGLSNVRFLPFQPVERLAASLGAADLHLASMHESACGLVVPSKVYGILAAGRPCVFIGPKTSEAARLIEENRCGEVVSPPDPAVLADVLQRWSDPARLAQGQAAAAALAPRLGLDAVLPRFRAILSAAPARR